METSNMTVDKMERFIESCSKIPRMIEEEFLEELDAVSYGKTDL